jgi:WD40 repeat protein/tRNA A-37 threonylcarbamoyl transferase component Bud32
LDARDAPDLRPNPGDLPGASGQPWRFGRYQVLEEISRGGAGIVFRARDEALDRDVALKFLRAGPLASRDDTRRLFLEARAAARLRHHCIVPVFEIGGADDPQPFLAMALLPGGTLAQRLKRGPVSPTEAARWLASIARAVHHAHQHGILHRDLKPGNILFDAEGSPMVSDFGLARLLDEDHTLTRTDAILGTPAYLAPEQASGRVGELTTAADIHALGAVLYECLTSRPPFEEQELPKLLRQIAEAPPVPPRQINFRIPTDLETICLKCLEKDPIKRYATAQELADELDRFLNDEPIQARPVRPAEKAWRWCRRNPAVTSLTAGSVLLLMAVAIGAPIAAIRINHERQRAEKSARNETRLREAAQVQTYTSDMNLAKQAWDEGNLRRAQALLTAHVPQAGQPDLRSFEWRYLWNLCQDNSLHTSRLPLSADDPVQALASSPAHNFAALACQNSVRLLDFATGQEIDRFPYAGPEGRHTSHLIKLASRATNLLVAHRVDGVVSLRDLTKKQWLMSFRPFGQSLASMALSPDGRLLAAGTSTNVALWDVSSRTAESAHALWSHGLERDCLYLMFTPDGQTLIAEVRSPRGGSLMAWDAQTGRELALFPPAPAGYIWAMAFSPDGLLLAYSGVSTRITVLDFARRTVKFSLDGHLGIVTSLAFSADGQRLLSSGLDGTIRQWDLRTGQRTGLWRDQHDNGVWWAGFAPGGQSLLSMNGDELKIWNAEEQSASTVIENEQDMGGPAPAISPDGKWLVTTGASSASITEHAKVWDLVARHERLHPVHDDEQARSPAFSPDGKLFALGSQGRMVGLWETAAWEHSSGQVLPFRYLTNDFEPGSIAFSPDGTILAAAGFIAEPRAPSHATNRLAFWEVGSWRKLDLLPGAGAGRNENAAAATVAFSPDGRWLALGSRDGWVRLRDFRTRRLIKEFQVYVSKARNHSVLGVMVAFSRDNGWLAAHSQGDRDVALLDLAHPEQPPRTLATDKHYRVWSLTFAPDGKSVVTAGNDGLIRFWNLQTLQVALSLHHGPGHSLFIAFAPDGNLLVSQESQGRLKLWPATPIEAIPQAQSATGERREIQNDK